MKGLSDAGGAEGVRDVRESLLGAVRARRIAARRVKQRAHRSRSRNRNAAAVTVTPIAAGGAHGEEARAVLAGLDAELAENGEAIGAAVGVVGRGAGGARVGG